MTSGYVKASSRSWIGDNRTRGGTPCVRGEVNAHIEAYVDGLESGDH